MLTGFTNLATHTVYLPGLDAGTTVVDFGANRGAFYDALSHRLQGGRFHAVEANPELIGSLRTRYESVRHCAVTDGTPEIILHVAQNSEMSSVLHLPGDVSEFGAVEVEKVRVPGMTMEDMLTDIDGHIGLVKVDIEGAEIEGIRSLSAPTLSRIGQLSIEFHRDPNCYFGLEEGTRQSISKLTAHGFIPLSFAAWDNDVLMLNRAHHSVPVSRERQWRWAANVVRGIDNVSQRSRPLRHRIGIRRRNADGPLWQPLKR